MSTSKFLIGAVLLAIVPLTACDKAELDATKQQLQVVSSERDALKTQLDASKQQAALLQQQVTDLQAKVVAATAALAAPAADAKPVGAKGDKKDATKGDEAGKKAAAGAKSSTAKPPASAQ
jgi:septal ring factor EnvC (AmiA/AmiB activator)